MVWCPNCAKNCERPGFVNGFLCCSICGRVINEDNFSDEPTFVKNAGGQSQLAGNFVKTVQSDYSASRHRTLTSAYADMDAMLNGMHISGGDTLLNPALAFYTIAVERNFTKGRKKEQVEAACLYIACRENKKAFLLIEFSDYLRINVYELGAVFLQLCKLLSLEEHPIVQKPVDPSLFIHRFAERLLGERNNEVNRTALRIIASMKRDWMQTGRKPSGLCGAALYISALSHGLKCSKMEVISVVHICEATLTRRLIEFENTESGALTIEEFNKKAEELEQEYRSAKQANIGSRLSGTNELLCEHKGSGKTSFAHGLCEGCYDDFIKLSGGLEGGSAPPAFQRAEQERITQEPTEENACNSNFVTMPCNERNYSKDLNAPFEKESNIPSVSVKENLQYTEPKNTGTSTEHEAIGKDAPDKLPGIDGMSATACDESESLSDIDDVEVDGYLHNEEEKHYKKIIWEEMNKEYLEEQAAKEAAAAAAKEAFKANLHNCPEDVQAAQELAAATAAAVAKSRKERQQKRAAEARNSVPAQTAAEATREMLTKKRLSSKINYDVLEKLFDDSVAPENPKKGRTETHLNNDNHLQHTDKKQPDSEGTYKNGESELEDEYEGLGNTGAYDKHLYNENADEVYDYDDDYAYDLY